MHDLWKIRIDTELEGPCVPQLMVQPQLSVDGPLKSEGSALLEQVRHLVVTDICSVGSWGILRAETYAKLLMPQSWNGVPPACPAQKTTSHHLRARGRAT